MLLFLTSSAAKTLDKLIPFLPQNPSEMKIAFVPTAGDVYQDTPWIEEDKNKLTELGFQINMVDIKYRKINDLKKEFDQVDIIFIAGGNTTYLLEQIQKSHCLNLIKEKVLNGTLYIGSSAGSIIAGPNIEIDNIFNDCGDYNAPLDSYEGLNLVNFIVLPHADNPLSTPYHQKITDKFKDKYKFRSLKDNQAIVVTDTKIQMIEV